MRHDPGPEAERRAAPQDEAGRCAAKPLGQAESIAPDALWVSHYPWTERQKGQVKSRDVSSFLDVKVPFFISPHPRRGPSQTRQARTLLRFAVGRREAPGHSGWHGHADRQSGPRPFHVGKTLDISTGQRRWIPPTRSTGFPDFWGET